MRKNNSGARGLIVSVTLLATAALAAVAAVTTRSKRPATPIAAVDALRPALLQVVPTATTPPAPVQGEGAEESLATTQTQVTAPPFTLTATLTRTVPESRPVVLALALRNNSAVERMIGGSAFEASSFRIAVTDGAGHLVPRTAVGERSLTSPMAVFANATVMIGPGQTLHYHYNLARLFDLSRAGNYSVRVARTLQVRTAASWPFSVPAPTPGRPAPPQEADLSLGPLPVRMVDDPAGISGPTALTPRPGGQTFLYVVSPYAPGIGRYRVGDDGSVSHAFAPPGPVPSIPPQGATYGAGPGTPVAAPDGRFLYSANGDHTLSQFRVGDNGVLSPLSPPSVPASPGPGTLVMDPRGRFLYALPGGTFAVGADGRLTSIGAPASVSPPPGATAIDSTGAHLYVCNGLTYGYRIDGSGGLKALPTPATSASGTDTGRDNVLALSPSGRFAYVGVSTEAGSAFFDLVVPMRIASDGTLTAIPGAARVPQTPAYQRGFSPYQCNALAMDPTGRFLIVVNPGFLDAYRIGSDGTLTPLGMMLVPGDLDSVFFLPGHPMIAYAINRNPPSLLAFRLDEERGLAPAGLDMPSSIPFQASVASAVAPVPDQWGPAAGGLEVSARLPADDLTLGRPIVLTVTLRNTTGSPLFLGPVGAEMTALRFSVTGPQSQSLGILRGGGESAASQVSMLAAGRDLFSTPGVGGVQVVLPPGGERAYRLVLTRLFDMTLAGNYTVQVTRMLSGGGAASSPVVPLLLEDPVNGVPWRRQKNGGRQEIDVP